MFDCEDPLPISVRINTTSCGKRPVTAKNRFDQPFGDDGRSPVTIIAPDVPDIRNLSIIDVATGSELTDATGPVCVPRVGDKGYSRQEFTTLEPDVPFESEIVVLSGNSDAWLKRVTGNALRIALRPYEV